MHHVTLPFMIVVESNPSRDHRVGEMDGWMDGYFEVVRLRLGSPWCPNKNAQHRVSQLLQSQALTQLLEPRVGVCCGCSSVEL
mmetsp:Transcript_21581/g.60004  ORF Transcript_21581/g.60004 Transcript_21581/m.60004 type:complete len:83 (-) Transcript_21581:897-1145(-)